ncbi:MAG: NAD(P)H-dependent flavin oxidoreductase [Acidimicrobiales bacterium]
MKGLSTAWSEAAGLRVPIVNAPMGGVAGGRLATAISVAGGLGMIGLGSAGSTKILEREVRYPRAARVGFGIGLVDWVVRRDPALLEAAIEARPVLVSVSFGDDWSWVHPVRGAGIVVATQVYDGDQARRAANAGIEVLVARGAEGGGHGQPMIGTLPLLESVLDSVDVPVLAAGGIGTGRGVAAVLAAGASGVWLGTAFAACPESLISDPARQALLRASGADTVVTTAFDVALGYPWPSEYPERVLRNDFTDRWSGHEAQLAVDGDARAAMVGGISDGDTALIPVDAGQGVGSLSEARSAAHVIERLCLEASSLLRSWAR